MRGPFCVILRRPKGNVRTWRCTGLYKPRNALTWYSKVATSWARDREGAVRSARHFINSMEAT
jgi:hypothetical protein